MDITAAILDYLPRVAWIRARNVAFEINHPFEAVRDELRRLIALPEAVVERRDGLLGHAAEYRFKRATAGSTAGAPT